MDPKSAKSINQFLLSARLDREQVERHFAELLLGVVHALRAGAMTVAQAEADVFNLDVRVAAEAAGIDAKLRDAMAWGMQLSDVSVLAPAKIEASFEAIEQRCRAVIRKQGLKAGTSKRGRRAINRRTVRSTADAA